MLEISACDLCLTRLLYYLFCKCCNVYFKTFYNIRIKWKKCKIKILENICMLAFNFISLFSHLDWNPCIASRQKKIWTLRMGDPNEITDLYVARNIEAQEVLHSRFIEGIRGQSRIEERGQASRFAAHRNSLRSKTCMCFFRIFPHSSSNKCVTLLF